MLLCLQFYFSWYIDAHNNHYRYETIYGSIVFFRFYCHKLCTQVTLFVFRPYSYLMCVCCRENETYTCNILTTFLVLMVEDKLLTLSSYFFMNFDQLNYVSSHVWRQTSYFSMSFDQLNSVNSYSWRQIINIIFILLMNFDQLNSASSHGWRQIIIIIILFHDLWPLKFSNDWISVLETLVNTRKHT